MFALFLTLRFFIASSSSASQAKDPKSTSFHITKMDLVPLECVDAFKGLYCFEVVHLSKPSMRGSRKFFSEGVQLFYVFLVD